MSSVVSLLRSASIVSIGTFVGQLIAFLGSLVLVRIYSPEQMGVLATIVAVSSFIAPLASGRLSGAIPLPQANLSAVKILRIAIFSSVVVSALICLFLLSMKKLAIKPLTFEDTTWLWGISLLIVTLVIYTGMNGLAVRFEQYLGLAVRGVLYPLAMTGSQILLGLVHFGSAGLVLGMGVGHVITAFTIWIPVSRLTKQETMPSSTWKQLISKYRHFPLLLGPAGAINSLAMQLPQIGVTAVFGLTVGGQFGMMMRILAVPVALLGQSIGFVYAGQIAKARRDGVKNVREVYDRMSLILGGVAFIFALFVFLFGEPIFSWLLGEEWRMSGQFAALFILAPAVQLVASPLSQTLVISQRTRQQLVIDVVRAGSLVISLLVLSHFRAGINTFVFLISVVTMAGYLLLWSFNRGASADINPQSSISE